MLTYFKILSKIQTLTFKEQKQDRRNTRKSFIPLYASETIDIQMPVAHQQMTVQI